jgi:hypothetical protein
MIGRPDFEPRAARFLGIAGRFAIAALLAFRYI